MNYSCFQLHCVTYLNNLECTGCICISIRKFNCLGLDDFTYALSSDARLHFLGFSWTCFIGVNISMTVRTKLSPFAVTNIKANCIFNCILVLAMREVFLILLYLALGRSDEKWPFVSRRLPGSIASSVQSKFIGRHCTETMPTRGKKRRLRKWISLTISSVKQWIWAAFETAR